MNQIVLKKLCCLCVLLIFGFSGIRCAVSKEELHVHGDSAPVKKYPKDHLHPLAEINFKKVAEENRGLRVLEENATTVHDYYRGSAQDKVEGERLFKEGKWDEARIHFEKSNGFLRVVLKYLPEDEAYRNIYGDHVVIFLPNLLMADNYLKLAWIFKRKEMDEKAVAAMEYGNDYLQRSLKNVKTEWAFQIKNGFEKESPKK